MSDPDLLCVYVLAERLHKTVQEIIAMPVTEFLGWLAYVEIKPARS